MGHLSNDFTMDFTFLRYVVFRNDEGTRYTDDDKYDVWMVRRESPCIGKIWNAGREDPDEHLGVGHYISMCRMHV